MGYVFAIVTGYLLGCSNLALLVAKLKKIDLRASGSGNPGTSNATILMGWRIGVLVGIHDIGKAWMAVFLAGLLFPQLPAVKEAAGIACVLGHIFPFYVGFKGGKGFASFLGMTLALNWKFALVVMAMVVLVTLITDYLVVGTFTAITVVPVYQGIAEKSWLVAAVLLIATAVILFRHRENIPRLLNGTEIGLRSTIQGKHKVK